MWFFRLAVHVVFVVVVVVVAAAIAAIIVGIIIVGIICAICAVPAAVDLATATTDMHNRVAAIVERNRCGIVSPSIDGDVDELEWTGRAISYSVLDPAV